MSLELFQMQSAAKLWVRLYRKRPLATILGTLALLAAFIVTISILDRIDREKREATRLKAVDYEVQVRSLNETEKNLKQLLAFIDSQKHALREAEDTIAALKQERDKLKPIVESNRAAVEAIFRAQEERANSSIWRERWIGFGLGVLSSLLATFIWFVGSQLWKQSSANP